MTTRVMAAVEAERASGFTGFAGTHVEATVPVTQRLLDGLVAFAGAQRHLSGLTVTLRDNHDIGVAVAKPVFGFETRLAIDLRIRGPIDLASDPRLYLLVSRPSMTWSAISRLAIAAGLAPPGVEVGRDGVAIDLRMLASRAGASDLLSLVRTIGFDQESGVLRIHLVAEVPDGGSRASATPAPPMDGASSRSAGRPANLPSLDVLLTELRGARVRGRIAVSEGLANTAMNIALDAARQGGAEGVGGAGPARSDAPAGPVAPGRLAGWIRQANLRFEQGRLVLEPDVVIG
jgi:hypothetical protein